MYGVTRTRAPFHTGVEEMEVFMVHVRVQSTKIAHDRTTSLGTHLAGFRVFPGRPQLISSMERGTSSERWWRLTRRSYMGEYTMTALFMNAAYPGECLEPECDWSTAST